ncbi:hypothetical protein DACRYDRAFT_20895 [Dacryopinax primogenitus]|uniref:Phosphatidylglycerol/phosphatidylinositol transfer protein n=1 Tax=Dacryopinax primogenitus (strain DJM 731) TaxID=1858805 RepID=M5G299_DACPD|nr:uncharacterized protein DACRYDRAFT_20895 [Dacryopinax primogenitus]EJU04326.1 hypothetical protein DACRYDRAFT_20895 [Dacryopinax primogenitus]
MLLNYLAFATLAAAAAWNPLQLVLPQEQAQVQVPATWAWKDCGDESFLVNVQTLEVSPDPPEPGKPLTLHGTGKVNGLIEDGAYANVLVKAGYVIILKKRFDLCEEAVNNNFTVQCPIDEGYHEITQTVELPREIPKFKYAIQIRGFTADEEDMTCLDITIDFKQPKPF